MQLLLNHTSRLLYWFWYIVLFLGLLYLFVQTLKMLWHNTTATTPARVPPGNWGLPFIGETIHFMAAINSNKGFYDFVKVRRLKYGNWFKTNIFGQTHVFISSTKAAKKILSNEGENFTKRYIKSIAKLVGDQSLLCASHEEHKLIRSHLNTLFTTASLSSMVRQFDELSVNNLSTWHQRSNVTILHEALKITLEAICKMLMNLEGEEELETLHKDVGLIYEAMLAFPLILPWTRFYKGLQARKRIMRLLDKIIEKRRKSKEKFDDLLAHLLSKDSGEEAIQLSNQQIKDNILTMIIAGQDTTASAITWMIKYLDENPDTLNQLRAEQQALQQKVSSNAHLTLEDLNCMPYASKVIKESLRMASIVPWFPRMALHDCEIEGFTIKKGWNVNVDAKSIHFDAMIFHDPNKFIPSRFDDDSKPYSFLAFGMGGRTCLGLHLARAMMLVFVHRLTTSYRWMVIDSDESIEKWTLFSRLRSGCPVRVTCLEKEREFPNASTT
ncbi:PREDICTED: abscisic acid 8'-hydroxylase 2 [Nicotiana attenuata]|uniref:Abscisic acid 8'-hydroxylase 2 n=1 Tax=Nicotiana attenuata TaxID=49451 RepID=A0A314KZ51_NICAT|nr:PREDICTED: abscisic acid 8'-hydroxylase 2 [Nicotiana attenuata]OIT34445.1 abscisic acid 8'-hydroxylase 2 [Nicotiana attenuata]